MKCPFATIRFAISLLFYAGCPASGAAPQSAFDKSNETPGNAGSLILAQALSRVFVDNPELNVSELEIQAASARFFQAGLKPNPELVVEAEDFAAIGGAGLFHYTESTFLISQRLELGGKRAKRMTAAEKEIGVAGSVREVRKAELIAATAHAFAEVLAGQERLANQRELNRLARQAYSIVVERVTAGKVSPVEQTRAGVSLASAQLDEDRQQHGLIAAKDRLAVLWGGTERDFERAEGTFEIPSVTLAKAGACIDKNPELKLADAAIEYRGAQLASEEAGRKPDLTVSAGLRRLNFEGLSAWVASVSIPLPLFDRRQGAIAEARIRRDRSLSEKKAIDRRLRASLTQSRHDYETAMLEKTSLTQTALPAAREALAAVEEGYRFGKFDFLNVLDAQRTYAELQRRHIEAVASGLSAAIELERLARCDSPAIPARPGVEIKEMGHEY